MIRLLFTLLLLVLFSGCQNKLPLFQQIADEHSGIDFNNHLTESDSLNILTYQYFYNGGGVAIGDINNDGLPDIFFTGNMVKSRLYLNKGNWHFSDITKRSGIDTEGKWASGASMVDINNDGYLDLYISLTGPYNESNRHNLFYINQGDGTFLEKAAEYGVDDAGATTHAVFFDYDKDEDLDLYLLTNTSERPGSNVAHNKIKDGRAENTDRLYKNNGDGTFTNVSGLAGILTEGYGLGVAVCDINGDNWPDLYVSNDYISNDLLYINNQDGTFTDRIHDYLKHQSYFSMGNDVADFNNDGLPDICTLDMLPQDNYSQKMMFGAMNYDRFTHTIDQGYDPQFKRNTLQVNNGNNTLSDVGQMAGVNATNWSWSVLMADYDNDGRKDLFITNGFVKDLTNLDFITYRSQHQGYFMKKGLKNSILLEQLSAVKSARVHNYIYQNKDNLTFSDHSEEWGMTDPSYSNGAAFADLDNDGDLDLVVNNINEPAFVYRNTSDQSDDTHFLRVRLSAENMALTYGAKLFLYKNGDVQTQYSSPYRGYISTVENIAHFGLDSVRMVDSLVVEWPDNRVSRMYSVKADQVLTIDHQKATSGLEHKIKKLQTNFLANRPKITYSHQENAFNDYTVQRLLPHQFSIGGPGLAVGDIDGDGTDDFYIGGAKGHQGSFFLQKADSLFVQQPLEADDGSCEDMGALLFDVDNDGDNDLYVVSGGSEDPEGSTYYQDRLFINNGSSGWEMDSLAIPALKSSGSVVIAADYDQDGDLDLFIGGRVKPGNYPESPSSYILRNNTMEKGDSTNHLPLFSDVTSEIAADIANIGMVNAALWSDYDNDGRMDLILAGEWMPVTFFKNTKTGFVNMTKESEVANFSGWWNSLAGADFDMDGDIDYVAGNMGLNTRYQANHEHPIRIYYADYDQNGSIDPIMTEYNLGKEVPVASRDDLFGQLVSVKHQFKDYDAYAQADMSDVLSRESIDKSTILTANHLESSYFENMGNGKFELHSLPRNVQTSPVTGLLPGDFDHDGKTDLLLTGNSYAMEIFSGWCDAGTGSFLKGDGHGHFSVSSLNQSGFAVNGDARALGLLSTSGSQVILATQNNGPLVTFANSGNSQKEIELRPEDSYAIIKTKDGGKYKVEFYYGSGYLTQSSRTLPVGKDIQSITIYDFLNESRTINPDDSLGIQKYQDTGISGYGIQDKEKNSKGSKS